MKKVLGRILSSVMVAVMLLTVAPLSGVADLFTSEASAAGYKTGDIITFGMYPQTEITDDYLKAIICETPRNDDGSYTYKNKTYFLIGTSLFTYEPIEWRVLGVESDGIYIVSEKALDCKQYNTSYTNITWADCSLRKWLNNEFYNIAFSSSEKKKIHRTHLRNGDNPWYGTPGGADTYDYVFIPSVADVLSEAYGFVNSTDSTEKRAVEPTGYAAAHGASAYYNYGKQTCYWWLRTPGYISDDACYVTIDGYLNYGGSNGGNTGVAVRPALKLNLGSAIYQSKNNIKYSIKAVDSSTGAPISDASVAFNGATIKTGSNGTAEINVGADTATTAQVTVSKGGYTVERLRLYEMNPYGQNTVALTQDFGISDKLSDILISGETIYGPTVKVLGKQFNLFSVDAKVKIPLTGVSVSIKQDTQKHTVKAILGLKDGYKYDSDAKWNEDYAKFKDYYQSYTGKSSSETLNKYRNLRDKLKTEDGSLGFGCSMTYAGFLEFDYSSGKMILKDGGITITAEANVSTDVPFAAICYATFKIGGELESKFTVSMQSNGYLGLTSKITLSVKPTIGVGAKLISKDVASIEAGIDGKISGSVTIPSASFSKAFEAYLSAQCYVKAKAIWIFEAKWSTNFPKLQLYPNFGEIQTASVGEIQKNDLKLIGRDYLDNRPLGTASVQTGGDLNDSSVYPYGIPRLISLDDGRVVALFLYDNGTRSDINRTILYYSVYENNRWSAACPVCNSSRADFPVQVCTDGSNVYAVWQRASELFEDTYTTDDVVTKTELVYSAFNGSEWENPEVIDAAGKYQLSYGIAHNNGEVTVAWQENSLNDYTLNNGDATVYSKTYSDGHWDATQTVTSVAGVTDVAVGYIDGECKVLYNVDSDADLTTSGDSDVYVDGVKLTDNDVDEGEVTYQNGSFWWISAGKLCNYDGENVNNTELALESDYRVISNGNITAVTFLESDGFKNELMVSYLNSDGSYTDPVTVTSYGKHISYYDALMNTNGSISVLADVENLSDDENDPYGDTDMVCDIISRQTDLGVGNIYYTGNIAVGSTITVNGTVTNNSTAPVSSYNIKLRDGEGNLMKNVAFANGLNSGESEDFSFTYTLPEDMSKQTYTVEVVASNDSDASNNTATFEIGLADIEVVGATITRDGTINATVVNNGFDIAENVEATISYFDGEKTALTTVNCGNIASGESKEITYKVSEEYLDFESAYVVNKFIIDVTTDSDEQSVGNNDCEVIYAPIGVESIALSASSLSLTLGSTSQLTATVYPADAYNKDIFWVSDSTDVATVDEYGNIRTVGEGMAIITAISDSGDHVASCTVTVSVPVEGINMALGSTTINVGQQVTMEYEFTPASPTNKNVIWSTSDSKVASVSNEGVVTGCSSGIATVTVTTADGGFTSSCDVRVINAVKGISLSENNISLYTGKTKQLYSTLTPADADNQNVYWISSDEDIATVSDTGLVTAIASGTVTITVMSVDGGYTASCNVTVGKHVTGVYLSEDSLSLVQGFSHQLIANVMPTKALNKNVTWLSMNPNVADVDEDGVVTAYKVGKAVIYVETEDGEFSATCTVTVTNSAAGYELNSHSEYIAVGGGVQLTGEFTPATAENKNVKWSTSDSSIATVDNGYVSGHRAGSAVITATTEDGGYKDYCIVRVVGLTASAGFIDAENGIIYGLSSGISSLDGYVELVDNTCSIEYEKNILGTGDVVNLVHNGDIIDSYTIVIFGDVNGDGWYDGQDAVLVSCLANGMLTQEQVGEAVYTAADCNHDGVIDELDVELLNQAGVLLSRINQSASQEELQTSSIYQEYIELIDQTPNIDTPTDESPVDDAPLDNIQYNGINFIALLKMIFNFIVNLISRIF